MSLFGLPKSVKNIFAKNRLLIDISSYKA